MHLVPRSVLAALALVPCLLAQQGPPAPSAELKKLEPLIGNWSGSGTFTEPGPTPKATRWTAVGGYRWVLGNFWVQEDFAITFAGNPQPLVHRAYLGWDAERKTFVNAGVNNGGEAQVHDMTLLPDGTLLQMMQQHQGGVPFAQRSRLQIGSDKLTHTIDLLMPEGPSVPLVDGIFTRQDAEVASALDAKGAWMNATPHESMPKLARMDGSYAFTGSMVMMPGAPAMKLTGVDAYRMIFGGTVQYAHTVGEAEGMPGKYECDYFCAHDSKKDCLIALFVSNMGEVGSMEMRFAPDGKSLLGTTAATMQGQPMVQRSIVALDDQGRPQSLVVHAIMGSAAPYENCHMSYTKQ